MKKSIDTEKWLSLISGILLVLTGFLNLTRPIGTVIMLVQLLGFSIIAVGVIQVIRYFKAEIFRSGVFLAEGVLNVIFGVLILRNIGVSSVALTKAVILWVLLSAFSNIIGAISFAKQKVSGGWISLMTGLLGVTLGFLMIGNFALRVRYITVVVSIYMIFAGINLILSFWIISKYQERYREFRGRFPQN